MAGVSTKDMKNRIRSMESTKQITKAMEMVAASKLRKAQAQVQSSRPYFETLYDVIHRIADADRDFSSPYLGKRTEGKTVYVVIAGDRGLAGGYNNNVLKLVTAHMAGKDAVVLPVGRKAVDYMKDHDVNLLSQSDTDAGDMTMGDCFTVAKTLCKGYLAGAYQEIFVVYTNFTSVLSQTPSCLRLLPLLRQEGEEGERRQDMAYEPDAQTVFDTIVPEYLGGILYGALCESRASEQAARRMAMDSATQNAEDMIGALRLQFNRARQAAITQEITEIVAGS